MSAIHTQCGKCSEKITVLFGADARSSSRRDGKQVVYTADYLAGQPVPPYDIFRCRGCGEVIAESCAEAAYGS